VKAKQDRKQGRSPRAFSVEDKAIIIAVLHEARFIDKSPREIYATLLDEGRYLCSLSTMYRWLRELKETRERRNILSHPNYKKPELLATGPNQVWSWDITKLKGPEKWCYYYLYVVIDIYSRKVVGWLIANRESAELAKILISDTCDKEKIQKDKLIIHSDRGPSMTSKAVALLLADLCVAKSLNRPHVSNDNPYSESQFKTLKYQPSFPEKFGSIEDARAFCRLFFAWYNTKHHHSGIAYLTPHVVHSGQAEAYLKNRKLTLEKAYRAHPERFVRGLPRPISLPKAVWINKPDDPQEDVVPQQSEEVSVR
jgi:putative transposase